MERNFGRGVASYFVYLKWLLFANVTALIFILLPFLIIPHLIKLQHNLSTSSKNYSYCVYDASEIFTLVELHQIEFKPINLLVANVS